MRTDRRGSGNQRFAQIAFDMIFLGIAYAPKVSIVAWQASKANSPAKYLPILASTPHSIPLSNRVAAFIHQVGRLELRQTFGGRVRNALVHADRPIEHNALPHVAGTGDGDGGAADANRFGGDQDAFWVETVEKQRKPYAFGADPG